ncbi:MAG: hypothetical protein JRL30_22085 [Deltaproteobacteria bacterium]|nr:hypothetical protein [Deltaproteobacteria bacterium]
MALKRKMDNNTEIRDFLKAIRRALPNAAAKTDKIMHERGYESEEDSEHLWVEALADVTNAHIQQRNQKEVKTQLRFFSEQFDRGPDAVKNCIDVSYVENLMWNLPPEDKKWVWPQIPENLQHLYIAIWGLPRF